MPRRTATTPAPQLPSTQAIKPITDHQARRYVRLLEQRRQIAASANQPITWISSVFVAPLLLECILVRPWAPLRGLVDAFIALCVQRSAILTSEMTVNLPQNLLEQRGVENIIPVFEGLRNLTETMSHAALELHFARSEINPSSPQSTVTLRSQMDRYLQILAHLLRDEPREFRYNEQLHADLSLHQIAQKGLELYDQFLANCNTLKNHVRSDEVVMANAINSVKNILINSEVIVIFLLQLFVVNRAVNYFIPRGFKLPKQPELPRELDSISSEDFDTYLNRLRCNVDDTAAIVEHRQRMSFRLALAYFTLLFIQWMSSGESPDNLSVLMLMTATSYAFGQVKDKVVLSCRNYKYMSNLETTKTFLRAEFKNIFAKVETIDLGDIDHSGYSLVIKDYDFCSRRELIAFYKSAFKKFGIRLHDQGQLNHFYIAASSIPNQSKLNKLKMFLINGRQCFVSIDQIRAQFEAELNQSPPQEFYSLDKSGLPRMHWKLFFVVNPKMKDELTQKINDVFEILDDSLRLLETDDGVYADFDCVKSDEGKFRQLTTFLSQNPVPQQAHPDPTSDDEESDSETEASAAAKAPKRKRQLTTSVTPQSAQHQPSQRIEWGGGLFFDPQQSGNIHEIRNARLGPNTRAFALFDIAPEQFPGGEQGQPYIQFKNIFSQPKIVPARGSSGLKWDNGHLKAKCTTGGNGHLRIWADDPERSDGGHLLYRFSHLRFD